MPAHKRGALIPATVPAFMRDMRAWLMWRLVQQPGEAKARKVPYYASGRVRRGVLNAPADVAQLVTFDQAREAAERLGFDGVGFAPRRELGIVALDVDGCAPGGKVDERVLDLVAGTYAELSPSGNGVRAFMRGQLGNNKSAPVAGGYGFEVFSCTGFVTVTGQVLPLCQQFDAVDTVAPVTDAVRALCAQRFAPEREDAGPVAPLGVRPELILEALEALPDDLAYDEWLAVGMALHHETAGEGFELWDAWSQRSTKYSTREYGLARWESFGRRAGPPVTIRSLVRMANGHGARISLQAQIDAAAFDDLTGGDAPKVETSEVLRFPLQRPADFVASAALRYWIKGVLPQTELAVVYGESGSGKTFAVLDLAMAIARGVPWRGCRVRQGRVVYIAAEGSGGFRKRVKAYADFHGVELSNLELLILADAPNFLLATDVKDVIRSVQAFGGTQVVVVDTLAQVTPGANENAGEDMGKVIEHCKQIHKHTGALVVLVHHSGKDPSKGARGWSGLKGAVDAEIEVTRDGDARQLRLSKSKDDVDGTAWGFKLNQVSVGQDEDGDPITSCVVEVSDPIAPKARARGLGTVESVVCQVLADLQGLADEPVRRDDLVAAVAPRLPRGEAIKDRRKETVDRSLEGLLEAGVLAVEGDLVRRA